ncbi:uncharacterized protein LOC134016697 [Osmerus eperlanus]|uniref:uncharacterized protein LOC134016697 n=1 Tax=Osmerus eperlanus TaxID=29151 RepID=UPI002E0EB8A6
MEQEQTEFLLNLYSSAVELQFEPKERIILAIQTILLFAPAVWVTNMCGEDGSVLFTVLKLTRQKRPVYLKDWSVNWTDENIKRFIQYLPHISQLWVSPQDETEVLANHLSLSAVQRSCIRHLCVYSALDNKETGQPSLQALLTALRSAYSSQLSARQFLQDLCAKLCCGEQVIFSLCEILCSSGELNTQLALSLLQAVNFNITLNGWLTTESCRALGSLLGSENVVPDGQRLNMTLTPESVSIEGAQLLFKQVKEIHTLRTNNISMLKLARLVKSKSFFSPLIIEELALVFSCPSSTKRVQGRLVSSLVSLLRVWRVKILNLRDCPLEGNFLTALLCLEAPLTIRQVEMCSLYIKTSTLLLTNTLRRTRT